MLYVGLNIYIYIYEYTLRLAIIQSKLRPISEFLYYLVKVS